MEKEQLTIEMIELVRKCVAFSNTKIEIHADSNFVEDLGLDSMGVVDIITKIEERYNIMVQDDEIVQIKTLNNAVELVISKLA